jgi:hypothetical protein
MESRNFFRTICNTYEKVNRKRFIARFSALLCNGPQDGGFRGAPRLRPYFVARAPGGGQLLRRAVRMVVVHALHPEKQGQGTVDIQKSEIVATHGTPPNRALFRDAIFMLAKTRA